MLMWYQVFLSNTNNQLTAWVGKSFVALWMKVLGFRFEVSNFELQLHRPQLAGTEEYTDPATNEFPRYGKQFYDKAPVILWEMRSTPSAQSLPGSLGPRVVAPDRVLSIGLIELN